jgi:plastocyanin
MIKTRPGKTGSGVLGAVTSLIAGGIIVGLMAFTVSGWSAGAAAAGGGTIKGHVRLQGKPAANPLIRMGMDPKCAQLNKGRRRAQEIVMVGADGGLANAFVKLTGTVAAAPAVSAAPVTLDQTGCIYVPRVLGARVGQTLQIRNSDEVLHNLHSLSPKANAFNVSQPKAGMVYEVKLKDEDAMLRLKCDIHGWMTAFIGVVNHPYFAVSGAAGEFEIRDVPAGSHPIRVWHEAYGELTQTVRVAAGGTATVDFNYTGNEKPVARIEERVIGLAELE